MSYAVVINSEGSGVIVSNSLVNAAAGSFAVDNAALDSDGNSFTIFGTSVVVSPIDPPAEGETGDNEIFVLRENRVFVL